ncbi:MAG: esterase [Rariglobus sp.]|jgi:lysophospholipase L1-like esterase|nr:esterase [Rariglobus sp.]
MAAPVCGRAAPVAPAAFMAIPVSWTQVRLSWTDQSTNESGFVIERRPGSDGAWAPVIITEPNLTRIEDVGLTAATSYTYRIKAIDTFGGASSHAFTSAIVIPAARKRPPIVVMPLGDSITRGTGGTQAGYRDPLYTRLKNAGYSISYAGSETTTATPLLTEAGNDHHEGHAGYAISQISGGLDGATTGWLTGVAGERDPVYPDVILLMAGTNDIGTGGSTGAAALTRMDALLNKLGTLRPAALIIVSTLVPYYGTTATREQRQLDYNAGLTSLVAAHRAAGRRVWLYDMRAKVNSPAQISSDGVHPNQSGYNAIAAGWFEAFQALPMIETWRHAKFGSASSQGAAADLADPDADGRCNLLEYALGGDPVLAGLGVVSPHASVVVEAGIERLALTFLRRRHADVAYTVETASDLNAGAIWTAGAVQIGAGLPVDDYFEKVTCRDTEPLVPGGRRFIRVRVSGP